MMRILETHPQHPELHEGQHSLDGAHASGVGGALNRPCLIEMVHALVGLASTLSVAQAERDDVVKWLVWRRADPEIRSGRLMKRAQDPGHTLIMGDRSGTAQSVLGADSGRRPRGRATGPREGPRRAGHVVEQDRRPLLPGWPVAHITAAPTDHERGGAFVCKPGAPRLRRRGRLSGCQQRGS